MLPRANHDNRHHRQRHDAIGEGEGRRHRRTSRCAGAVHDQGSSEAGLKERGITMARRGRKRKVGPREPNGRIQRKTTLAQIEEMDRKQREQEMSVVLAQPHRRGDRDQRLGSAVGRYCKALGLSDDIYMACQDYATAETRWLSGWGKPKGFEQHEGGSGAGPSAEQMDKWLKRIKTVESAVKDKFGWTAFCAVRRLVVEDADVEESPSLMKAALAQVAVALGYLENNPHPFVG